MAFLAFAWLFAALAAPLPVEAAESGGLEYDSNSGSMVPLPPAERLLAAAHAEHFIQVDKAPIRLKARGLPTMAHSIFAMSARTGFIGLTRQRGN